MRLTLVLCCFMWLTRNANAQLPTPFSGYHLLSYPKDGWGLIKAPVYWGKQEWGRTLAATAVIYAAFSLDQDVQDWISKKPVNSFSNGFLAGTRHWGDGLYSLPVFAGVYFYGSYQHNPKHQLAAINATKAFVLSRLLVQIPKFLFQRQPPSAEGESSHTDFAGPWGGGDNRSFPSGHVISAFSAAEVFRLSYDDWWVGGLAYTLASSVAVHRVANGNHWFSDVATSAIWGAAIGHWISQKGSTRLSLFSGSLSQSTTTLGVVCRF